MNQQEKLSSIVFSSFFILIIVGTILGVYFGTNAFGNNPEPTPTTPTPSTTSTVEKVGLFSDCDFKGKSQLLGPGKYDINIESNDSVSSLKIPNGRHIQLFEHYNFLGKSITYSSDVSCLNSEWNNMASSFIIT